jgi:hypothetical protein
MVRQVLKVVLVCHLIKFIVKEKKDERGRKEQQGGGQAPINAVLIKTKHRYYFQAKGS